MHKAMIYILRFTNLYFHNQICHFQKQGEEIVHQTQNPITVWGSFDGMLFNEMFWICDLLFFFYFFYDEPLIL